MIALYIIIFFIACFVLVRSADWAVKSLTYLAGYWKLSEFVVSFILAGLATSLPELFVGIMAAFNRTPTLSLGNVIGSNIADIGLVVGLVAVLANGLITEGKSIQKNTLYTALIIIYPLLLLLDGKLSRVDGIALLVAFILYNLVLYHQSERFSKTVEGVSRKEATKKMIIFVIAICLLLLSATLITDASEYLASALMIPPLLIGLFLIAVGTSLPELAFSIRSVFKGHKEMVVGGILGSLVTNSTLILGVTAIICPIQVIAFNLFFISSVFMIANIILLWLFIRSKNIISWREGMILVVFYVVFLAVQFLQKR